jgi:hypothetical protein
MALRPQQELEIVDAFKKVGEFVGHFAILAAKAMAANPRPEVKEAEPLVYNRKQAALAIGVSVSTLDRIVAAGELKQVRVTGRSPKYEPKEIERFLTRKRANVIE